MGIRHLSGSPWHKERVHREEGDDRRYKGRCEFFSYKDESAADGVDVPALLQEIINKEVYKEDYASITTYFQRHPLRYEEAIDAVKTIAESGAFE